MGQPEHASSTTTEKGAAQFVVVANRLPVDRVVDDDGHLSWRTSPGGLVTALEPAMREQGGAWVGWHGAPDEAVKPFAVDGYQAIPVALSAREVEDYYEGFSNATLWPLYHDCIAAPEYHRTWWEAYRAVNQHFAKAAAEVAAEGATVWVQDYQLQLVPAMLRELRPDVRIGFFLHIPFPPVDLFSKLPWRRQILEGMLGADLIGFQVPKDATNFIWLARHHSEVTASGDTITAPDGRHVRARAYPISIDAEQFRNLAQSDEAKAEAAQLRENLGNPKRIFLGVDRLDYTKGLVQRVRAFGELFRDELLDPAECVFLQIASPSRVRVREYMRLRDEIDLMVGRINSQVGEIGNPPVVCRQDSFGRTTMAAMYSIADVMVVTPLRDGMNLVAKEYVASRVADDGALVLSEFAGAARELKQAYQVNPYDLDELKRTILTAAFDEPADKARRMRSLRRQVQRHQISAWTEKFLGDLAG